MTCRMGESGWAGGGLDGDGEAADAVLALDGAGSVGDIASVAGADSGGTEAEVEVEGARGDEAASALAVAAGAAGGGWLFASAVGSVMLAATAASEPSPAAAASVWEAACSSVAAGKSVEVCEAIAGGRADARAC